MTSTPPQRPASFQTTRWTRVCQAKESSEEGRMALAELCEAYYEPVVVFLRGVLHDADAARDMSHAFFEEMLGGGAISAADQGRGRFRSYLLGAVRHFVARQRQTSQRLKRGAGLEAASIGDDAMAALCDTGMRSPDAAFDHQWALTVLERSLEALRAECHNEGRGHFFDLVRPALTGDSAHGDQRAIAAACGMGVEALRVAVHRLKKRLRQRVKAEISATLEDSAAVADEMRILLEALGR